jgi:hypothetical protein
MILTVTIRMTSYSLTTLYICFLLLLSFFLPESDLFYLIIVSLDGYCWPWSLPMTHIHSVGLLGRGITPKYRLVSDNTQYSQETGIHDSGGIRTSNPSKRTAAELHLRPRDNGDWPVNIIMNKISVRLHFRWFVIVADIYLQWINSAVNVLLFSVCAKHLFRHITQHCASRFVRCDDEIVLVKLTEILLYTCQSWGTVTDCRWQNFSNYDWKILQ